jgi:hypothetical protein
VSCYCCVIKCAQIHDPLGDEGDVLGACYLCHVHACGHHADRSADDAQYLCVLCEKTLLTASSFLRTRDSDYTRSLLARTGNERLLTLRRESAFRNVRQFARLHPRVWEVIAATPQWNREEPIHSLLPPVLEMLNTEEREMLLAAVCLALGLRIPREDVERILLDASPELAAEAPSRRDRR